LFAASRRLWKTVPPLGMSFITQCAFIALKDRREPAMSETSVDDKDYLIQAMQKDLDRILAEEPSQTDSQSAGTRQAVTTVLVESVHTQRLYFVVRSVLMSLISALIYFTVVLYFGTIDAFQAAFLGFFVFVAALVVSRLFDKQIVKASKKIIQYLNKYDRVRKFVLKRL
jgi:ABC-type transport system involved in cytochrome bd biosynthesis fused ATPase/permease subunit